MWSLVHAAERFDDMVYVASFLEALPALAIASTRWASVLMMHLLNSDTVRPELVRQLRIAASDVKRSAVFLCEQINDTDARFLAKTTAVLVAGNG